MAVSWDSGVNTKVLRNGTDWSEPDTIIEDKTRSGKQKRRLYASNEKRLFQVAFNFNMTEYANWITWFNNSIKRGMYSFDFPKIDSLDKTVMQEYRISKSGYPKYSNDSGKIIKCSMTWEEV